MLQDKTTSKYTYSVILSLKNAANTDDESGQALSLTFIYRLIILVPPAYMYLPLNRPLYILIIPIIHLKFYQISVMYNIMF